jgi:hypothetical protein
MIANWRRCESHLGAVQPARQRCASLARSGVNCSRRERWRQTLKSRARPRGRPLGAAGDSSATTNEIAGFANGYAEFWTLRAGHGGLDDGNGREHNRPPLAIAIDLGPAGHAAKAPLGYPRS